VPADIAIRALDGSGQNANDAVNYTEFLAWVGKPASSGRSSPFRPSSRSKAAASLVSAQAHHQADHLGGAGDGSNAGKKEDSPASASTATPAGLATPLGIRSERQDEKRPQAEQRQVVQKGQKEWKARIERAELAYKAGSLADALDQIEIAFSQRLGDDKNAAVVRLRSDIEEAAKAQDRQFRCGLARSSPYQGKRTSWASARQQVTSLPLPDVCLVEQSMEAEWPLLSWEQRWLVFHPAQVASATGPA